jgi:signal transduction histidine kinase
MITAIKTKERYKYLLILLHCSLVALSQNSKPTSFKDFPIVQNLDSFEQVVRATKNNPEQYLYGLITLEKNREDYIGWFGQDLDTIKILADSLNVPLGVASYHYFLGLKSRIQSINIACRNLLQAIEYFQTTKDTLGLVKSYYGMLLIGTLPKIYKMDKVQNRSFYFDKIMNLSQSTSDRQVKFVRIYAISFFERLAKGQQNYKARIGEIEETLHILDKNPNIQPPYAQLYAGISNFYHLNNFPQLSFNYQLKSHELFQKLSSKICVKSYLNTATGYFNDSSHTKAEPFLLKGISTMEQLKEEERDNTTLLNLYVILSEVQFFKKDYKAAHASWEKTIAVQHKKNSAVQISLFQELQTQYEINQKEMDNTLLIKKNELSEIRNKQYMTALYIAFASLGIFSVLVYFLYKLNAKQKQLILFRDQLFAIIAHDMRTPLIAFKGFSEGVAFLMKKGEYQNIHILSQSIDQLIFNTNLLFDNLLNWYALQSNTTKTNKNTFRVYELAKESADLYESIAKNRQIKIELAIPETLTIYANKNALLLILRNLIDNAIKHGKSKKIQIKASLEIFNIVIEVINAETTIPNNRLTTLQEQMKQGSVVIKEGRGLGLYLVSYFVEQHKGSVSIESSEEQGTRFRVEIPANG